MIPIYKKKDQKDQKRATGSDCLRTGLQVQIQDQRITGSDQRILNITEEWHDTYIQKRIRGSQVNTRIRGSEDHRIRSEGHRIGLSKDRITGLYRIRGSEGQGITGSDQRFRAQRVLGSQGESITGSD
jgi:hypothetical protein